MMRTLCPHCNTDIGIKTRLRLFKDVKRGTISPIRRCPSCRNWMVMKTSYVVVLDILILGYLVLSFVRVMHFYIAVVLFLLTIILFTLFAPLKKYNKEVLNVDNVIIEGKDKEETM